MLHTCLGVITFIQMLCGCRNGSKESVKRKTVCLLTQAVMLKSIVDVVSLIVIIVFEIISLVEFMVVLINGLYSWNRRAR